MTPSTPHRVVVVGGGFGGLQAVRALRDAPVEITLVDRRNFHLFQPLLYQVATGALSPGEIASPLRGMFKRRRDVRVVLGEVGGFDLERRHVLLERMANGEARAPLEYDTLVVAAGAAHAYFGHEEWRHAAPGLKTLEDAIEIRARILAAFEAAEVEEDPGRQAAWLTFVVVGAGPTGVEMAGQIAEIAKDTLANDFHRIDPRGARILLLEGADRVLGTFPPKLSARAARALERLGVTLMVDHLVVGVGPDAVEVQGSDGAHERIPARTFVWAAGVRASRLAAALGEATGAPVDKAGRVTVAPDLTLPGHPEVLALGDMVRVLDANGGLQDLPGVAPTAMQEGRYAANVILARLKGAEHKPFHYVDKGNVATIGRLKAVADIRGMRLSGTLAWLTWLFVHLFYLVGLQNRTLVFIRWVVSFSTRGRGARLITGERSEVVAPADEQERETREAARTR
jgi:NADH:quinone reductase (non-electrogenic)